MHGILVISVYLKVCNNCDEVSVHIFHICQVLDFIYTGQLHHAGDQGVLDLLRAASYLQLSDLAALCRRRLKSCRSSTWSLSTTSSSTTNGHLKVGFNYHSGSMAVGRMRDELQRDDLSKEELFTAQRVDSSTAVEFNESVETGLKPTGSTASSLQQSSTHSNTNSPDHLPFSSTSAFYNPKLEHIGEQCHPTSDSQQTAAHRRPRSGWEGCLEGSVQTKRQEIESGELVQVEWRVSSELEDRVEVGEEDLVLKNELQSSEKKELKGNKHFIHHQPQPGFQPVSHNKLYMCIPCGKGFPSSEQLIAHVHSHAAKEQRIKVEDAEEGSLIKFEGQDSEILPSQSMTEETKLDVQPSCHVCLVCSKSYVDVALLRQHERSHWLNRPFSCNICGKPFTQRGTMMRHMRGHLGLKPYACEECGMRFTRQYRKMEHMRIHSREKMCECPLCGEKFTQQRSLFSHLKMHTVVS